MINNNENNSNSGNQNENINSKVLANTDKINNLENIKTKKDNAKNTSKNDRLLLPKIEQNFPNRNINNIQNEDEEKILSTFNRLKDALIETCSSTEEVIKKIYENKMNSIKRTENNKNYLNKIKNFQNKIKTAQSEINLELTTNKIDELEYMYDQQKSKLENLKMENLYYNNISQKKNSQNSNTENDSINKKEELYSLNQKILELKEEAKIKQNYNETLTNKIKGQNEDINKLQNLCQLIKKNIKYYQNLSVQKNNNEEEIDMNKLETEYNEKMDKFQKKYNNLQEKINEQNEKIKKIDESIGTITKDINKINSQIRTNTIQINIFENNIRKKESKIYDIINKKNNNSVNRKPFFIPPIYNNDDPEKKKKKIFNYQKYLRSYETRNKNKNKKNSHTNTFSNKILETLNEIEKLKIDIQKSLNNNNYNYTIDQIIHDLKSSNNKIYIKKDKYEDEFQNLINQNQGSNFWVTEGANLPISLKEQNINNILNYNY